MSLLRDQNVRSILWTFSSLAPIAAVVLLALCFWPRTRRAAFTILALSVIVAALATVWFHFVHVTPIWNGHVSAIRTLDRAAFTSAFAIAACCSAVACLVYRVVWRPGTGKSAAQESVG